MLALCRWMCYIACIINRLLWGTKEKGEKMSAYMVDREHIAYLIDAALRAGFHGPAAEEAKQRVS